MIPQLQDIGAKRKVLPLGRHSCTLDEVKRTYVPINDVNRLEIWNRFIKVLDAIRRFVAPVPEVWIGGSFVTSEELPHDIDVVFLFQASNLVSLHNEKVGSYILSVLARQVRDREQLDEKVDGYLIVVPPTEIGLNEDFNYSSQRGYWDQFWSKARFNNLDDDRWLYPAAGYLEVIVDGYRV